MARTPWTGFDFATACCKISPALAITATSNRRLPCRRPERGFSPSPDFTPDTAQWDRTYGLLLPRAELALRLRWKGLLVRASLELDEPVSRHPALRVCSDTQIFRLPAGWSIPRPLNRLAPA